jgi:tetratricopeptide (TPR) repeat protein
MIGNPRVGSPCGRHLLITSAAFVLWAGADARAQAPAGSAAATVQFDRGRALFKAGKYAEACAAFEHSQKLDPASGTLYNLAGCHMKIGKLASAWLAYRELAQRDTNAARRGDSAKKARELEPRLPRLLIKTTPAAEGLVVTMNGQDVTAVLGVENPVDLGSYTLVAKAPQFKDRETSVEVATEAKLVTVTLVLERAPVREVAPSVIAADAARAAAATREAGTSEPIDRPAPAPSSNRRTYAAIAGGGGVALLATGLLFGNLARNKWSDAKALCGDDLTCSPDQHDAGRRLSDAAHLDATLATGLAIGGSLALGVGAYLWFTAPARADRTALRLRPGAGPASVGVTLQGGF